MAGTAALMLGSALCGAAVATLYSTFRQTKKKPKKDPETDHSIGHEKVWTSIGGALQAAMVYVGDKLDLYTTLKQECSDGGYVTAAELAKATGYSERWLEEWLAQQASMGILLLGSTTSDNKNETLRFRLPKAMGEVLADPSSKEYDVAMIKAVPSLVTRAKTMIPEAFRTGIGHPYNDKEISLGIDRQHQVHIRDVLLPEVIPSAEDGRLVQMLEFGVIVADLGCGAGNLVIAMAQKYPNSTFHGFEVSEEALSLAAQNLAKVKLRNVFFHNANVAGQDMGSFENKFDVVTTFDVLHDAPNPAELIRQVRRSIKNKHGIWLLGDIPCKDSVRENITDNPLAATYFAFSTSLCMSCSLSTKDGAGLGTVGFTVPVAKKMLTEGGFGSVEVLKEFSTVRWFLVKP